jgi:hypothetical protein
MDNTILEYLEGYFGGQLNESTSDDDIMEAFADLLETADAVKEFLNLNEISSRLKLKVAKKRMKQMGQELAHGDITGSEKFKDSTHTMRTRLDRRIAARVRGETTPKPKNPRASVGTSPQQDHRKELGIRRALKTLRSLGKERLGKKIASKSAVSMAKYLKKQPEHRAAATAALKYRHGV